MRKRIFSILLTLCMALSLMPTVAFGANSYDVWISGIQVTSDNAIGGSATNSYAIMGHEINISGTVTAIGGMATSNSYGVFSGSSASE
ncbi:MAG: hypothetical protein PHU31_04060 [Anaerotignum sp.]|nr:hypothetical protein [Anaerotignum sp.]